MVRRPFIAALILAASLAPVSLLSGFTFQERPAPAEVTVTTPDQPQPEVVLTWVVRTSDFVSCETAAPFLRQVRHENRGRFRLVVYGVATDSTLMRSFLQDEMLSAGVELRSFTESQFQQRFAHLNGRTFSTPLLVITDARGREQVFSADVRLADGRRDVDAAEFALDAVLRSAGALASRRE